MSFALASRFSVKRKNKQQLSSAVKTQTIFYSQRRDVRHSFHDVMVRGMLERRRERLEGERE